MTETKLSTLRRDDSSTHIYHRYANQYGVEALKQVLRYMTGQDDYNVIGYELTLGRITYPHQVVEALLTVQTNSLIYRINYETPNNQPACMTFFRLGHTANNVWIPTNILYFEQLCSDKFY